MPTRKGVRGRRTGRRAAATGKPTSGSARSAAIRRCRGDHARRHSAPRDRARRQGSGARSAAGSGRADVPDSRAAPTHSSMRRRGARRAPPSPASHRRHRRDSSERRADRGLVFAAASGRTPATTCLAVAPPSAAAAIPPAGDGCGRFHAGIRARPALDQAITISAVRSSVHSRSSHLTERSATCALLMRWHASRSDAPTATCRGRIRHLPQKAAPRLRSAPSVRRADGVAADAAAVSVLPSRFPNGSDAAESLEMPFRLGRELGRAGRHR